MCEERRVFREVVSEIKSDPYLPSPFQHTIIPYDPFPPLTEAGAITPPVFLKERQYQWKIDLSYSCAPPLIHWNTIKYKTRKSKERRANKTQRQAQKCTH